MLEVHLPGREVELRGTALRVAFWARLRGQRRFPDAQALAEQIPEVVGEPLEDEHHNPLNGDALQQTTKGLMAWRKADNWTAFTDGTRSWINGPYGVQSRPNEERFPWEKDRPAPRPTGQPRVNFPGSSAPSGCPGAG